MATLKNAKKEKFIQCLIQGMSQRKAYREAYPNAMKWKDGTVDSRASELFKDSEILGRYEELIKQTEDKAVMNAIERKKWLTKKVLDREEKTENQLKALDILNKMDGEYTNKVEMTGEMNVHNPFADLTTEELKQYAGVKDG